MLFRLCMYEYNIVVYNLSYIIVVILLLLF